MDKELQKELESAIKLVQENEETASFSELADLLGLNLKTDFVGDNLTGFDLSNLDLNHADFQRSNLSHVNLTGTNLSYANLSNANLSYANLSNANLSYANLSNANLSYATVCGANLCEVNFTNTTITNIEIDDTTKISLKEVVKVAIRKKRPVLNFSLGFSLVHGDEAPIFHLSKVLGSLQSLINNIGQAIVLTRTGAIPEDIADKTSINASLFFQGSFGIQIVASNTDSLLGDSTITDAIEAFVDLVSASQNINDMQRCLGKLKHDSANNYKNFIKIMRDSGASLNVEWSAANEVNRNSSARLSPSEIENALEVVKQVASENIATINVEAELVAGNSETRHFVMRDINSDKKYPGYILSEALQNGEELILGKLYRATIEATTKEYMISKETTVSYKLISFHQLLRKQQQETEEEKESLQEGKIAENKSYRNSQLSIELSSRNDE